MKKGDTKTVNYEVRERECETCGNVATHCLTFLFENARRNPASAGYRGDDISWCTDSTTYSCDEHKEEIRHHPPEGMKWCSDFYRYSDDGKESQMNAGRYLYWEKLNETVTSTS